MKDTDTYSDAPEEPSKADRVDYLADLMASGRYRTRLTVRALMKVWKLAEITLNLDVAEASRTLRCDPEQREEQRARLRATFDNIAMTALSKENKITGLPDFASAIKAYELLGQYSGLANKEEQA